MNYLGFRNNHGATLWVAVLSYSPEQCSKGWVSTGWWELGPGGEALTISTRNRYAYFYAEAEDGVYWGGGYGPFHVTPYAFKLCFGVANTDAYSVGMRLLDLGSSGSSIFPSVHIVNLL